MDEKVLEELEFHQESVAKDASSPLHLIREKEMEISGRVLAAKQEAEGVIASARKAAAQTVSRAQEESEASAAERERQVAAEVEAEIERVKEQSVQDERELSAAIETRRQQAASYLVRTAETL